MCTAGTRSTPGVLYALDGVTGKELWNSAKTVTGGALWTSVGHVHTATTDGTLYSWKDTEMFSASFRSHTNGDSTSYTPEFFLPT